MSSCTERNRTLVRYRIASVTIKRSKRVAYVGERGTFAHGAHSFFCDLWECEGLFVLNVNQPNNTSITAHRLP